MHLSEYLRFILFYPCQFGSRKVSGRIQKMCQALLFADRLESAIPIRHRTTVAPDHRRTQHLHLPVHQYEPMHLVRDADRIYLRSLDARLRDRTLYRFFQIHPPVIRILLRPSGTHGFDRRLFFRIKIRGKRQPRIFIDNRSLHRRTSNITT